MDWLLDWESHWKIGLILKAATIRFGILIVRFINQFNYWKNKYPWSNKGTRRDEKKIYELGNLFLIAESIKKKKSESFIKNAKNRNQKNQIFTSQKII